MARKKAVSRGERRRRLAQSLQSFSRSEKWAASSNAAKRRIAALEAAVTDGIDLLAEDIQGMFQNFALVADSHDSHELTIAAIKGVLLDKGVITEDEFQEKRSYFVDLMNKDRERRQAALDKALKEAEAKELKEEPEEDDPHADVDPELKRMRAAAAAAGQSRSDPPEATVFSLS